LTEVAISGPLLLSAAVALLAGVVSFASPCVVPGPRLPGLPRRVGGADVPRAPGPPPSAGRQRSGPYRVLPGGWRVAGAAALFVAGFTAVFASMLLGAVEVADALVRSELLLQRIDGVVHARSTRPSSRSPAWVRSYSPSAWPCRRRRRWQCVAASASAADQVGPW
jgi:cytochrome c-type biogenesis protein